MRTAQFFGVLLLGVAIGVGGLILYARTQQRPVAVSAAENYNQCIQDAKIGMLEQKSELVLPWMEKAMAKCAKQYRLDRENEK
jgi:hypothetical protein